MMMTEKVKIGGKIHAATKPGVVDTYQGAKPLCGQTNRKVNARFIHPEFEIDCRKCLCD